MSVSRPGRVLRVGLLLPLLAGVLAMHVLLLCSGSGEGHSGHGAPASPASPVAVERMAHAMTTAAAPVLEGAATVVRALPDAGPGGLGLAVCLAVLGAGLVSALRGRARRVLRSSGVAALRSSGAPATARPPPAVPLRVLLCVSRT